MRWLHHLVLVPAMCGKTVKSLTLNLRPQMNEFLSNGLLDRPWNIIKKRSQKRRMKRRLVTVAIVLLLLGLLMLVTGCASPVPPLCEPLKRMPAPALSQSPSTTPYSTQWQKLEEESQSKLTNGKVTP